MINEDFEKRKEAEMQLNDKVAVKAAQIKKLISLSTDTERIKKALEWNGNKPQRTFDFLRENNIIAESLTVEDVKNVAVEE